MAASSINTATSHQGEAPRRKVLLANPRGFCAGVQRAIDVVEQALARHGAVQCGYCSAGLVVGLTWLHAQADVPDRDAAAAQLCGHLCRCTGYGGLQRTLDALFGPAP